MHIAHVFSTTRTCIATFIVRFFATISPKITYFLLLSEYLANKCSFNGSELLAALCLTMLELQILQNNVMVGLQRQNWVSGCQSKKIEHKMCALRAVFSCVSAFQLSCKFSDDGVGKDFGDIADGDARPGSEMVIAYVIDPSGLAGTEASSVTVLEELQGVAGG
jgi:hypothetical protein